MSRIDQGDTSSSAIRIADQLSPQQKLSASSRSFAVVASLNPGLVDKFHLEFLDLEFLDLEFLGKAQQFAGPGS